MASPPDDALTFWMNSWITREDRISDGWPSTKQEPNPPKNATNGATANFCLNIKDFNVHSNGVIPGRPVRK
jgi:hypothetical protein